MPMNCNADTRDWFIVRATGPRRTEAATCYHCGGDVEDTPRFGNEAICFECSRREPVDPWLAREGTR
jgi:hypothetical protein